MCYTYDNLSRVTARTIVNLSDNSQTQETFTYDAAGNITGGSAGTTFVYGTNNKLTSFNGQAVSYDADGNMLSYGSKSFAYDVGNKLITADGHTYFYNAEGVRIRNLCSSEDTTYTYNTNAKLSMLLMKTTDGVVTKYVYGKGLIGEETSSTFKTYHFDYRGSTVAITNINGGITDTFAYDTYGKLISRTGSSTVIFGYNGRDGVVTDSNGLIYMRARYYSPELRRFINADIVAGEISNAVTLNRYVYANATPVFYVDPFGLSAERGGLSEIDYKFILSIFDQVFSISKTYDISSIEYTKGVGNYKFYRKIEESIGSGLLTEEDIMKILNGQSGLIASSDFYDGNFVVKTYEDSVEIEYSVQVNETNTISSYIKLQADRTVTGEYKVSTKLAEGYSLTTIYGVEGKRDDDDSKKETFDEKAEKEKSKGNSGSFAPPEMDKSYYFKMGVVIIFLVGVAAVSGQLWVVGALV